jgi:hypothetical protein
MLSVTAIVAAAMMVLDQASVATENLADRLPRCWLLVLKVIAITFLLLGFACLIRQDLQVSCLFLVGTSVVIYKHFCEGGANSLVEEGVGCDSLFCMVDDDDDDDDIHNGETDTVFSGETWDSETDEVDEWQWIQRLAGLGGNEDDDDHNNAMRLRRRPIVVAFAAAGGGAGEEL